MKCRILLLSLILTGLQLHAFSQTGSYWSLNGNANTTLSNKLGTTSNVSLRFITNNAERMKIHASGNVGIGTPSPVQKLHVVGRGLFTAGLTVSENGIAGINSSTGGTGVYGSSTNNVSGGYGIHGFSTHIGVYGEGNNFGLFGRGGTGIVGIGIANQGDGLRGTAFGTGGYGIYAYSDASHGIHGVTNNSASYAGYFEGDVYSTGMYVGSDRALKENVNDVTNAMGLLKKLQPKTYTFRQDGTYKSMNLSGGLHYGFVAQEVEQVLPHLVKATTFEAGRAKLTATQSFDAAPASGTIAFKALNYTELIPIVIKGMQELDATNKALEDENKAIKEELAELRQLVLTLKNGLTGSSAVTITAAYLEQARPNPAWGNTVIRYQVPVTAAAAHIAITNAKGQVIKTFSISNKGAGQVTFNATTVAVGIYHYTLWVDGKQAGSKRLIVAK